MPAMDKWSLRMRTLPMCCGMRCMHMLWSQYVSHHVQHSDSTMHPAACGARQQWLCWTCHLPMLRGLHGVMRRVPRPCDRLDNAWCSVHEWTCRQGLQMWVCIGSGVVEVCACAGGDNKDVCRVTASPGTCLCVWLVC